MNDVQLTQPPNLLKEEPLPARKCESGSPFRESEGSTGEGVISIFSISKMARTLNDSGKVKRKMLLLLFQFTNQFYEE
jgi:hypothetical protein